MLNVTHGQAPHPQKILQLNTDTRQVWCAGQIDIRQPIYQIFSKKENLLLATCPAHTVFQEGTKLLIWEWSVSIKIVSHQSYFLVFRALVRNFITSKQQNTPRQATDLRGKQASTSLSWDSFTKTGIVNVVNHGERSGWTRAEQNW